MIPDKYSNLFLSVALLAIIITVIWYSLDNYSGFIENQRRLAERSVKSTAREIEFFISEQNRFVQLFAEREQSLLSNLIHNPNDKAAHEKLKHKVDIYFPKRFAFTTTDAKGNPILKQEQDLIGKTCRQDILKFIAKPSHYLSYVHPSPKTKRRHFDVMSGFSYGRNKKSVFFVSFFLDDVFRLLENGKTDGHHLFLIKHGNQPIIEATTSDAVSQLEKAGYHFAPIASTKANEQRLLWNKDLNKQRMSSVLIPYTQWELLDIPNHKLTERHRNNLILQGFIVLGIFSLITAAGFWLSRRLGIVSNDTYTLISSVETERQRMAMDLHDTVLSDVSHMRRECKKVYATHSIDKTIKEYSKSFDEELENITNSIRDIIDDLHPQSINLLGLPETIRSYCDRHRNNEPGLRINIQMKKWDENKINQNERLNIYRIFQEIMHNITKHSQASLCNISLKMTDNDLLFSIKDNGIGLPSRNNTTMNGRGKKNIRARANAIRAKISWRNRKNISGTVFNLDMPLTDEKNER